MGGLRWPPHFFWDATISDVRAAVLGDYERRQEREKSEWERARWMSAILLQPHTEKGKGVKPSDICIFPWESKGGKSGAGNMVAMAMLRNKQKEDGSK